MHLPVISASTGRLLKKWRHVAYVAGKILLTKIKAFIILNDDESTTTGVSRTCEDDRFAGTP